MAIQLNMRPDIPPVEWDEFDANYPPFSIAADGFVRGPPRASLGSRNGPKQTLNHHEGVVSDATRCTSAQAIMAIRRGLFSCFRDEHGPRAIVWVNDCDEDVCLTWFLLKHHVLCRNVMSPALNRLIHMEDMLDSTAGTYPFPLDMPILQELAWVFEPYRQFRQSGGLSRKIPAEYLSVVTSVEHRIMQHIMGRGDALDMDFEYKTLGGGDGWVMIKELGAQARQALFSKGIEAYVTVRERPNGRFDYVFGRISSYIPFPIPLLTARMNELEGTPADPWGGSEIVMGSPRVAGSKLSPDQVQQAIHELLDQNRLAA